jgi:hypothetical protein
MLNKAGACFTAALVCAFLPGYGGEGNGLDYKFQYYRDNNDVTVTSNAINLGAKLGEKGHLAVGYLVDGITGASRRDIHGTSQGIDGITGASAVVPDGITSASPEVREHRHQVSGTLSFTHDFIKMVSADKNNDDPTVMSVTGVNSQENDYTSRTFSAALSQDLFQRNTTLGVRYGKSFDQFRPDARYTPRNDDGWFFFGNGKRETERVSASLSQGITTTTVAALIWGYVYDRGYLSRPYYMIEIDSLYYHENLPVKRRSMTITGRLNQYIPAGSGLSLHIDYRYYTDSWNLVSHTLSGELYIRLGDFFILRPLYRFYMQSNAFFYADVYTEPVQYLTTDFKYRQSQTHTAGLKFSWQLRDFVKPEENRFFAFYPVAVDVAGEFYQRTGTKDAVVRNTHYNYWPTYDGYRAFWIQSGMRFAF